MNEIVFTPKGELLVTPSLTSSRNDFDFLEGKWNIHNRKLKSRFTHSTEWIEFDANQEMRKVLTGIGNVENISAVLDGKPYEGMAVRLFNPITKLWSIYWADNNSGTMDKPVVGSFENKVGIFFGRDNFEGVEIILQFRWDATNPEEPIWSQAFSADNGKTWEWNWHMYFTKKDNSSKQNPDVGQRIQVIELRNYLIRPGRRDEFINYFEENFIQSQNELNGFVLGQYRIKDTDDNFFWIRGFKDMPSRKKFLQDFYYGSFWKQNRNVPNSMLLNNDNVHLLKPLNINESAIENEIGFNSKWFGKKKGIAVVDFFISNTKLNKLILFVKNHYAEILSNAGVENTSFWVSETTSNDFTDLPVFQDKNLLVQITFYKDELEHQIQMKVVNSKINDEQKADLADLVTLKNTLIVYPTEKSFRKINFGYQKTFLKKIGKMTQIKKASINELDSLSDLFDKYRVFYKNASDIKSAKKFLTERITNNDAKLFVCFNEENIMVAFVQLYPLFSSTRMKKLWLLNDLYVDENYRGKGYALALINKAKELCEATSACGLILETSKENTVGNNLYSKTGFDLDKEHNFYSWNVAASSTA